MNQLLAQLAGNQLAGFILVLARVTPLFFLAPLFSSKMIPARVRGIVAVALSMGLAPVALHGQHIPSDALSLAGLVIEGLLVGFGFAFGLAALMAAVESAGSLADVLAGFSFGALIDPMNGNPGAGALAVLLAGGHADLPDHRRRRMGAARAGAHLPTRAAHLRAAALLAGGRRRARLRHDLRRRPWRSPRRW